MTVNSRIKHFTDLMREFSSIRLFGMLRLTNNRYESIHLRLESNPGFISDEFLYINKYIYI